MYASEYFDYFSTVTFWVYLGFVHSFCCGGHLFLNLTTRFQNSPPFFILCAVQIHLPVLDLHPNQVHQQLTFSAPSTAASTSAGQSSHSSLLATSPATSTTVSSHPSLLATSSATSTNVLSHSSLLATSPATSTTVSSHPSLLATSPGTSTTVSSHRSLVATSSTTPTTVSSHPSVVTTSSAAYTTVPSHSSFNTVSFMPTGMHAPPLALTKKSKKKNQKKTLNVRSQADQSENSLIMHPRCKLQYPENQKK